MSAAFYKCYQSEKVFFSTGVSSFMLCVQFMLIASCILRRLTLTVPSDCSTWLPHHCVQVQPQHVTASSSVQQTFHTGHSGPASHVLSVQLTHCAAHLLGINLLKIVTNRISVTIWINTCYVYATATIYICWDVHSEILATMCHIVQHSCLPLMYMYL